MNYWDTLTDPAYWEFMGLMFVMGVLPLIVMMSAAGVLLMGFFRLWDYCRRRAR